MLTCLREQEVEAHRHVQKLVVWILTISNVIFQITSVATYVTFVVIMIFKSNGVALNYNVLYGSMSALKLVTSPLITVLQLIPALQNGLTSLERIQRFLLGGSLGQEEEGHTAAQPTITEDIELLPLRSQTPSVGHDLALPIFAMKDATFEVDETPLLTNINLKVSKRESQFLVDTSLISYRGQACIL
jgi:ABC-type multidrug transport system fused ATPase/permease subunit